MPKVGFLTLGTLGTSEISVAKISMERVLIAILSADVEGYSRLMSDNEVETAQTLLGPEIYRVIEKNGFRKKGVKNGMARNP